VRRVALTLRTDAVEDVLDLLMPLLPQGVYERALDAERTEVAFYGDALPPGDELDAMSGRALLARDEEEVADDRAARRRRAGRAWEVAGRIRVRSPEDPPAPAPSGPPDHTAPAPSGAPNPIPPAPSGGGLLDIVIEPVAGAFGTGAHPTTRMSLELLLRLEPAGGFADLGCGAGVLAIAAAGLGWDPVFAVDVEARAVEATRRNAERNGAAVHAVQADLREVPPPPARTLAANLPFFVHERLAGRLDDLTDHVIASGIVDDQADATAALYALAGRRERARASERGWAALWLART
jgi:ribosomal protein L11 methyltransferase